MLYNHIICYTIICYAMQPYFLLYNHILCYAITFYDMQPYSTLYNHILCSTIIFYSMQSYAMLSNHILCYAIIFYAIQSYSMLCNIILCYENLSGACGFSSKPDNTINSFFQNEWYLAADISIINCTLLYGRLQLQLCPIPIEEAMSQSVSFLLLNI